MRWAVIDGIVLKGRHIVIPTSLRQGVLDQLHTDHMGIEKPSYLHTNLFIGLA